MTKGLAARLPLDLLRERNLRRLFAAQAASVLGSSMMPIALSFAVLEHGGGASGVGLVLGAQTAPLIIFLLAGGVLADRWGRRITMIGSDLVRAAIEITVVVILLTVGMPLGGFVAFAAVLSVAAAFFHPAFHGFIPEVVPEDRLQEANALGSTLNSIGSLLGPAVCGALVVWTDPAWVIAIDAGTFLASALFLAGVRTSSAKNAVREGESFAEQLRHGWREFSSRTWLWSLLAYTSLACTFVLGPVMVLGIAFVGGKENGAAQWGTVMAAQGVGSLLGGLVGMRVRFRRPLLASVFCTFGLGAFAALLAVRAPVYVLVVGSLLSGAGFALLHILWTSSLQADVPSDAMSRVSAYDGVASVLSMTVGYWWAAPAAAEFGAAPLLWFGAVWTVASAAVMVTLPQIRRSAPRAGEDADSGGVAPEPRETSTAH
ncbi:MFS transporter [Streptomyces bobili]|uniref:MFS transporter n=1 Tax=Streptomyces bobili TaxID=67280 RepID=UPI00225436D9|nr:MFS transporter [Streptomyces bobili]MCX5521417.1 MFS transporter [Streptomyces bobili]